MVVVRVPLKTGAIISKHHNNTPFKINEKPRISPFGQAKVFS